MTDLERAGAACGFVPLLRGGLRRATTAGLRALAAAGVTVALVASSAAGARAATSAGADATPATTRPAQGDAEDDGPRFLRTVRDDDGTLALEIAVTRYERPDGAGPDVALVGVVHIGDRIYYRALQTILDEYDLVLYESVKPAGTGGAVTDDDATHEERVERTRAAMEFTAGLIEMHRRRLGAWPADLAALRRFAVEVDPRAGAFLDAAAVDAWGRPIAYVAPPADGAPDARGRLVSFGADGRPGGTGADADLVQEDAGPTSALTGPEGDNLQAQLARALALSFQLDEIDYGRAHFRCSDMAVDEVARAMRERGSDFTVLEDSLAGSSLPARFVGVVLGLVRLADAFTGGAMSDMIKVVLIEMLGDETLIDASLRQFGEGMAEVLIDERNKVVVEDLAIAVADAGEDDSIAIFYGAGHMADLAERLHERFELGPVETRWLRAIEVDPARSGMSEGDLRRLRFMMRRAMRQATGRPSATPR